ncbi:hypothetical protein ROHU_025360 [Labeo rohita]|uniref:Uncharacterized protein n=1 Tax=Labeo rohita TaxID=84645 RepID=A0A498MFP8_LABRO|nr:hypothetical protein ROHU_025360 [Labeo rohita]
MEKEKRRKLQVKSRSITGSVTSGVLQAVAHTVFKLKGTAVCKREDQRSGFSLSISQKNIDSTAVFL